jgi:hypothetical protein
MAATGSLFAAPAGTATAACSAASAAHTVALLELYTSEGCDSCPPADRWLRGLPAAGFTPDKVAALSLHVDYWDYIGWKDPYAKAAFGARQKAAGAISKSTVVYTPQVMLAGRDFRRWSAGGLADEVARINARPPRAAIALAMRDAGNGRIAIEASASTPRGADRADAALYLAFYQSGLKSEVHAGENKGATLQHDYVAREWSGAVALDAEGRATASLAGAAGAAARGQAGAVAFVQNRRTGEVLQALALPWCGG